MVGDAAAAAPVRSSIVAPMVADSSRRGGPFRRSLAVALASAAWVVLVPPLGAAAEPPAPGTPVASEAVDVRLVEIDVVATDSSGRPITDLPREAFTLLEDGKPVALSHFEAPARAAAPAPAARPEKEDAARDEDPAPARRGEPGVREPLLVALFVDDLAVGSATRITLLAGLLHELTDQLDPGDRVAIARFDGSAQELLAPSADRRALRAVFEKLEPLSPARIAADTERRSVLDAIRQDALEGPCLHGEAIARGYAESARRDTEASAAALASYVSSLAGLPGKKSVLYVSDGPAFVPGLEALEYAIQLCDGTAVNQGVPGAQDSGTFGEEKYDRFDPRKVSLAFAEFSTETLWQNVIGHANAVGVTLYAIQAGTLGAHALPDARESQVQTASLGTTTEQNRGVVLPLLADGTGGRALGRGGDAGTLVTGLIDDLATRYTLAFAPAERARTGLRRIEVAVDRPGVRLRYRQSYLVRRPQEEVAEQLFAFLLRGEGRNDLALGFAPLATGREAAPKLRLEIPLERLTLVDAPQGGRHASLVAYVALKDAGGRISPARHRALEIAVPAGGPGEGERYRFDLELPKSETRSEVAVALVDLYSGEIAFARTALR